MTYAGGRYPIGYCYVEGRLASDPDVSPVIREAFERYAEGASMGEVASFLADAGFPRNRTTVKKAILSNPCYIGKRKVGEEMMDYCEPIIDMDLWNAVQIRLQENAAPPERSRSFAFVGLARCTCGRMLSPHTTMVRRGEKTYEYSSYRCTQGHRDRHSANKRCGVTGAISETALEKLVLAGLLPALATRIQHQIKEGRDATQLRGAYALIQSDAFADLLQNEKNEVLKGILTEIRVNIPARSIYFGW